MKKIQYISRKGNFDSGHRVMNEFMKCFNIHGHTYLYELTFSFENMEEIGYAIDFKEIKRVFCQWIDDILDHGMLLNPKDEKLIQTTKDYGTKLWLMSLNGEGEYCNPSVENIAKEVFLAMEVLSETLYAKTPTGLKIHKVQIYETPNCSTECLLESISDKESVNFWKAKSKAIKEYAKEKGVLEYDDRKLKTNNMYTKTTTEDVKIMSLYEYLGRAAGSDLGKLVYAAASKERVSVETHEVSNPKYTGKILRYPKTFLDGYFKNK